LEIKNDDKIKNELVKFLSSIFKIAVQFLTDQSAIYIWHASSTSFEFKLAMTLSGIIEKQTIIWVKPSLVMGHDDYQWRHEPCFYGHKQGLNSKWYGDRTETSVWNISTQRGNQFQASLASGFFVSSTKESIYITEKIPKNNKDRILRLKNNQALTFSTGNNQSTVWEIKRQSTGMHPTEKPPALAMIALENSSEAGNTVLDTFLGSGSTMVACQKMDRRCYGIEISPDYCAVVLQRMMDAFPGIKIERIGAQGTARPT